MNTRRHRAVHISPEEYQRGVDMLLVYYGYVPQTTAVVPQTTAVASTVSADNDLKNTAMDEAPAWLFGGGGNSDKMNEAP